MSLSYNQNTATWTGGPETDINGAGLSWVSSAGTVKLIYRVGNKLWTNGDIEIDAGRSYKIDDIPVLTSTELGPTIVSSYLQEVGALNTLDVIGDTNIADFAFFNASAGRFGIGNPTPNARLSIIDNEVELIAGSQSVGTASIGTYTNHNLQLISDNTVRINLKNTGEIDLNGDVTINGTLTVDSVVSDTRVDRYSPLEFKATRDTSIYGQGLVWSGTGDQRHLLMMGAPDRLQSSESFDLGLDQTYMINGKMVLSTNALGDEVWKSSLTKVGTLQGLAVQGLSTFFGNIDATPAAIQARTLTLVDRLDFLAFSGNQINANQKISVTIAQDEVLYADQQQVAIGNKNNKNRPVKVFGQLTVGVNNPDEDVNLAVAGNVSLNGKKFTSGTSAPTEGTHAIGDICWNTQPQAHNYVGWICTQEGAPGVWLPFGAINYQ